jgi:pimeloyl-ACP methyl ester carboxylesterase
MIDERIELRDGRRVGYTDFGRADQTAVLWCHGGPGSRLEAMSLGPVASDAGLRIIGIDRPGYGKSSLKPGRSIADWVPDGLAVADHLGIQRFIAVGVSTGGAYSLALAANAPQRLMGVVACCALTDMRWAEGKALMMQSGTGDVWNAPSRDAAIALITETFGADGSKMFSSAAGPSTLPPADLALMADPEFMAGMMKAFPEMFANGVQAYVDDRLADGPGWGSFDVAKVRCPVTVLHGERDSIVPLAHARHTAAIVPGAKLHVAPELGHFSIMGKIIEEIAALVG